jgi:hypothetical protein
MGDTKLPIFETAWKSYRDGLRAVVSMPQLAIVCLIAALGTSVVDFMLWPKGSADKPVGIELLSFGVWVVQAGLFAPLAIAVHRYVLLGKVTRTYALDLGSARFKNFVFYGVLLQAPTTLTSLLEGLISSATIFALNMAFLYLFVRLVVLFPAIAIDGPGAHPITALQNTRGHGIRALCTFLVAISAPILLIFLFVVPYVLLMQPAKGWENSALFRITLAPFGVLGLAVFAALASHLYRAWSRQPLPPAATIQE